MATYEIELPSGGTYQIEHDSEDLTQDQVLQVLARHLQSSTPRKAMAEEIENNSNVGLGKVLDNATAGIATGTSMLGSAAKRILPRAIGKYLPGSEEVETLRGAPDASGWASAGEIATNVGATMVPLAKGTQMLSRALSAVPRVGGTTAALAGAAGAGAGVGALTHPDSASQGATEGAIGALAGEALGRGLRRVVGGVFRPTPEAKRLMDAGVQPTVGQAVDKNTLIGGHVSNMEGRFASTPYVGASTQAARIRPTRELMEEAIKKAVPPGAKIPRVGNDPSTALKKIGEDINDGYRKIFDGVKVKIDSKFTQGMLDKIDAIAANRNLNPAERQELITAANNFLSRPNVGGAKPFDLISVKEQLYGIERTGASSQLRDAAADFRTELTDWVGKHVSKGSAETYKTLNAKRTTLDRLERAVRSASSDGGRFTADQLNSVVTKYPDPALTALAKDGSEILENSFSKGRFFGGSVPTSGPNLISAAATLGTSSRPVQKLMLGGYDSQQKASEGFRKLLPAIRQYLYESNRSD